MLICPGGVARVLGACTIFLEGSNLKKKKRKKKDIIIIWKWKIRFEHWLVF